MQSIFAVIVLVLASSGAEAGTFHNPALEARIEALFDGRCDLAEVKLAIDRMAAPLLNVDVATGVIDAMAADLDRLSQGADGSVEKLKILRR